MSKQIFLSVVVIFLFSQTGNALNVGISVSPTPTKKIRFTVDQTSDYVASFISGIRGLNYKNIQTTLSKHFSQQMEQKVSGSIWENTKEDFEIMFPIYDMKNKYIGSVRVGNKFFINDGNFFYHIGELMDSLEKALGFNVQIIGVREKGDNSRQEIISSGDDFMILKL